MCYCYIDFMLLKYCMKSSNSDYIHSIKCIMSSRDVWPLVIKIKHNLKRSYSNAHCYGTQLNEKQNTKINSCRQSWNDRNFDETIINENEVESTLISSKAISMQWNWGYWAIYNSKAVIWVQNQRIFNNWLFRLIQLKQINQQQKIYTKRTNTHTHTQCLCDPLSACSSYYNRAITLWPHFISPFRNRITTVFSHWTNVPLRCVCRCVHVFFVVVHSIVRNIIQFQF